MQVSGASLLVAAATVAAGLALAAPALARAEPVATAPEHSFGTGRAAAGSYWTPERIAAAPGLGIDAGGRVRTARPGPAAITAGALRSVRVRNPARYPNRVHGKLLGTFRGLGDFACSATVVSSRSGSLLTTAGHCAFDAGGTGRFATNLAFVPGYSRGETPYGVWSVGHVIVPGAWARFGSPDFDIAMLRARRRQAGTLESVVGARGIGFGQSRKQRLQAYGFPGGGRPAYDGTRLIRCDSRQSADPGRFGGPRGRGIRCDMGRGASGGGWVAQRAIVVSNTSHAYSRRARGRIFGPYYGKAIKRLYRAKLKGWPSIGPARCEGRVATIVGTDRPERLRGSRGRDVIAALGGNDVVRGGKGEDLICGGAGRDGLSGNGGRDRLVGGPGSDECRGGGGRDRVRCRRVA